MGSEFCWWIGWDPKVGGDEFLRGGIQLFPCMALMELNNFSCNQILQVKYSERPPSHHHGGKLISPKGGVGNDFWEFSSQFKGFNKELKRILSTIVILFFPENADN